MPIETLILSSPKHRSFLAQNVTTSLKNYPTSNMLMRQCITWFISNKMLLKIGFTNHMNHVPSNALTKIKLLKIFIVAIFWRLQSTLSHSYVLADKTIRHIYTNLLNNI